MSQRQFWVGGMFKHKPTESLANTFNAEKLDPNTEVVIAPPLIQITAFENLIKQPKVQIAAQNCHSSLTGEISPWQLVEENIPYVILGHSDRRIIFKEDPQLIAATACIAIGLGLKVVLCITEVGQLKFVDPHVDWSKIVIAYQTDDYTQKVTPEDIYPALRGIRAFVSKHVSSNVANKIQIVFGGNLDQFIHDIKMFVFSSGNCVDGFLVSNASLSTLVPLINARKGKGRPLWYDEDLVIPQWSTL
ncbi:triose phosphate isomerase [Pholiota molesta]|nr:triose phosphate isomerase [Pholiota molesta]